jgi:hypothetical protein
MPAFSFDGESNTAPKGQEIMQRIVTFCLLLVVLLGISGCSLPNMSAPTPSVPVLPPVVTKVSVVNTLAPLPTFTKAAGAQTLAPTLPAPTSAATQAATKAGGATQAPTAQAATATKPAATATKPPATATKPAATATQAPVSAKEARIFLIAINDNGVSGKKIGCGDSLVPVTFTLPDPAAPLRGALDKLFSIRTQFYGQSGLYNALFRSDLHIDSVTIQNGVAEIKLGGALTLGGVCDSPRVQAQLDEIALQFSTVQQVNVYINGKNLKDLLSGK